MSVSVVIPAFNAADTLGETLESLCAQTYRDWTAIVVDDGSTDATPAIAEHWARRDARIRTITLPHAGEAGARNSGLRSARAEWVLFLDADDWLLPDHLERLMRRIDGDGSLDAVHCGSARVAPDGTRIIERYRPPEGDLFPVLARRAAFPVHACIVRRALVREIGEFDATLRTSPDWDLWQRIARTGARFGGVPDVLALYRMRPGSASMNAAQLARDGLTVLRRGHAPDPRVRRPLAAHANGLPAESLDAQAFHLITWCAGIAIGQGDDATDLLDLVAGQSAPRLDAAGIAQTLFDAIPVARCVPPDHWPALLPVVGRCLATYLEALEHRIGAPGLAGSARIALERRILDHLPDRPLTIGAMHAIAVDVREPIDDVAVAAGVQRVRCRVGLADGSRDDIELPVFERRLSADVLRDAIAAEHAWALVRDHFERAVYPHLELRRDEAGMAAFRNGRRIASGLRGTEPEVRERMHDHVGWLVFLQETWNRPSWQNDDFYDASLRGTAARTITAAGREVDIEIGEPLPDIVAPMGIDVIVRVGGVPLVRLPFTDPHVRAQQVRAAVTRLCGFELCRAVAREALVGTPADDPRPLHLRLADAAARRTRLGRETTHGAHGEPLPSTTGWRHAALPATAVDDTVRPPLRQRALLATTHAGPVTRRLPILRFPRVAPGELEPVRLEEILRALRGKGWHAASLAEWCTAQAAGEPLPGRRVTLTFDGATIDFAMHAWPLLRRHDLTATLFITTGDVGREDSLAWHEIAALCDAGIEPASASVSNLCLPAVSPEDIAHEAATSRRAIEARLDRRVTAFAYPYGREDAVVRHIVEACGYGCAVRPGSAPATLDGPPMTLPRMAVSPDESAATLLARITAGAP